MMSMSINSVVKATIGLALLSASFMLVPQTVLASAKAFSVTQREDALQTLGDLKPAYIDFSVKAPPTIAAEEIVRRYVALIKSAKDPELRIRALHRLANIELRMTDTKPEGLLDNEFWTIAIDSYQEVLKLNPARPDADELYYQLGHAFHMKGDPKRALESLQRLPQSYPSSRYLVEAHFRIAEFQYSFGNYAEAEKAYAMVIRDGKQSALANKAYYMLGWTLYQLDRHDQALTQFVSVLDTFHTQPEAELNQIDKDLMEDTLRIMSVIFAYRQGAEAVAALIDRHDRHQYAHLLYSRLADFYLQRKRYQDTAATADTFIKNYPQDARAPLFAVRRIEAFQAGNFQAQVWPEKRRFVESFGIYSTYWPAQNDETRKLVEPFLNSYLDELSRLHYAQGQKERGETARDEYRKAAAYFRHHAEAFPAEAGAGEKYFLMGEALVNAGDYEPAIAAYNKAAFESPAFKKRAEAGYAAVVTYDTLVKESSGAEQDAWRKRRIAGLGQFAEAFPTDERVSGLLLLASNERLALFQYKESMETARKIIRSERRVPREHMRGAWLAHGHSAFELSLFNEAEVSFKEALKLWDGDANTRRDVEEKMAASVYKQGEELVAQNQPLEAVDQFLRVASVAPNSSLRANAQYDAGMKLLEAKQWPRAIEVLDDFRRRFPTHESAAGITDQLIFAYQNNLQLDMAAKELLVVAQKDADPDRRRKALFQAGELLEEAGQTTAAINAYQDYVRNYRQPLTPAVEVHHKLGILYAAKSDINQRNTWLSALIKLDAEGGTQRDDRTRYLAANASWELVLEEKSRFDEIKLTLPLQQSLSRKRTSLQQVLDMLKRTNDYGVAEFATAATHLTGSVYEQLSKDIMASTRPTNLNELETEQYDLLLEEQAFPFEERAIEFFELNTQRTKDGIYDKWVKESFEVLGKMVPARYGKNEKRINVVTQLR
jgi:cellulose synthase operon protein C